MKHEGFCDLSCETCDATWREWNTIRREILEKQQETANGNQEKDEEGDGEAAEREAPEEAKVPEA